MRQIGKCIGAAFVLFFLVALGNVYAGGRPFITRWEGKAGEALKIPIVGKYTVVVKNAGGDELKREEVSITDPAAPYTFTPESDGEYLVEAGPEGVEYIRMAEVGLKKYGSCEQLLWVEQFGNVVWTTMELAFCQCFKMQFKDGIGKPNLAQVTDMHEMFYGCSSFNQPLEGWNVSGVMNMSHLFSGCASFNQPLEGWDVSKVTRMDGMFAVCNSFNQPLAEWNVSQVKRMDAMFSSCTSFNQPLEGWDVSQVTDMHNMFSGCTSFNQPLEGWNVSQVTDMIAMFLGCTSFNQPLEGWDVSQVTNMAGMFRACSSFNQPLKTWNVSQVINMWGMFFGCSSFNQSLEGWDVSQVKNMDDIFSGCRSFNQPLGSWKLQKGLNLVSTAMSPFNYSQSLVGWANQSDIASGLEIKASGRHYNAQGQRARATLTTEKGWNIRGDAYQGSGLTLSPQEVHLGVGQECELTLESWGLEDGETVAFSGMGGVVVLSTEPELNGQHTFRIKAIQEGDITLKATSSNQNLEATCQVKTQAAVAPTQLTLNRRELRLEKGQKVHFLLGYTPAEYVLKGYDVTTLPEGYVKVIKQSDDTFLVEALQPTPDGTPVTLTVKAAHGSAEEVTCQVTVDHKLVAPSKLVLGSNNLVLNEEDEQTLTVTYEPSEDVLKGYTFTTDLSGYIEVTSQGDDALHIKALQPTPIGMPVTLTVKAAHGSAEEVTCQVTVNRKLVAPIKLVLSSYNLVLDEENEQTLAVTYEPSEDVLKGYTFTTTPKDYIEVTSQGDDALHIKALKPTPDGMPVTLTVKATHGSAEEVTCQVTVKGKVKIPPTHIELAATTLELPVSYSVSLPLVFEPTVDVDKAVTITTEPEGYVTAELQEDDWLRVKAERLVEGNKAIKVTVTSDRNKDVFDVCEVTVLPLPAPNNIALSRETLVMQEEEQEMLTITFDPETNVDQSVTIIDDPSDYISVTQQEGNKLLVKALKATPAGKTVTLKVKSTNGDAEATCEVTVTPKPVAPKTISLSERTLSLEKDTEQTLTVTYEPSENVLKGYTFTTDLSGYIEVTPLNDDELHIKALQPTPDGTPVTLIVTSTNGDAEATCEVTVTPPVVAPTHLSLSENDVALYVGTKLELTVGFTPSQYVFREVLVSALPEGFVSVSEKDGVVSIVALDQPTPAGTPVKVVVTSEKDPSVQASCDVTIRPLQIPTQLSLNQDKIERYVGQRSTLTLTFAPTENVDPRVTVSALPEGFVTTRIEGNKLLINAQKPTAAGQPVTVTVSSVAAPAIKASCEVTVLPLRVPTKIELSKNEISLYAGESNTLGIAFTPDTYVEQGVSLSVSPEGFVTARLDDTQVIVTALKPTTTPVKIVVTSEKAPSVSATCQVTVLPPAAPTQLTLSQNTLQLNVDGESTLVVDFTPSIYVDKGLTVTAQPEGYVEATLQEESVIVKALRPTPKETPVTVTIASTKASAVTATCVVTVLWNAPTALTLSKNETTLQEGASEELTLQITPTENVDKDVTIDAKPEGFVTATVSEGKVTLVAVKATPKNTPVTVTVTSAARSTVKATCTVTVTPKPTQQPGNNQPPQAVEDAVLSSIVVAPNPFSTQLRLGNPTSVVVRYELVNSSGVVVRSGLLEGNDVTVDTEALPAGIYFVRFYGANSSQKTVKVVRY